MIMGKEASILILEDSPADADLVERELRKGGIAFVSKRLERETDFAKAITDSPPDLIVSDYRLGAFDGLQALAMVRQQCPDVPFVLVSGVAGEELAVEALTRGATDYVLKDRLYRLVPAVRHALEQAERRRAERVAVEAERKFSALTETVPAIVFVHQDGKFIYLNPAVEQILGYSPAELLKTNFWNLIHPDFRELVRTRGLSRQQGEAIPARYEFAVVTRSGATRWLDCTAAQIEFDGQPAVLGSAFDITEQKQVEEALRASKERFASFMEHLPGAAWMKDSRGRYIYANGMAEKLFQITLGDLLGRSDDELFPPAVAARFKQNDRLAIRALNGVERVETFPQQDGTHHSLLRTFPIFGRDGRPVLLGGVAFDITERLRVEEALRESEQRFRLLVEAMPDFIFRLRGDGTILDFKAPKAADLSANASDLSGKVLQELVPERLVEPARYCLECALQTNDVHSFEFQFPLRDEMRDFEARLTACGANEVLAIVSDVTERKRLEEEVLEISARERRRFGHDLHDGLGQFLAGVAVKAGLLMDDLAAASSPHKPAAKELVRLIKSAVGQTRRLARGLDPIELEVSGLVPAIEKLARETEDLFHLRCDLHAAEPSLTVSKFVGLQLYRIVQEGVNNAIKHGHPQRIEIGLASEGTHIRLYIKDDGSGFRSDTPGRTGMGLRIMQYRAHVIGGVLKVVSHPGRGTEIHCLVPVTPGRPAKARVGRPSD